ncbi:sigma-54 dependent transcriptional regulator [Gallaecimonas kandeliae]|uniref:sigma-54-dependent transcriptional regulator n=1 Tax=Gallaecimonas kandeliae TaxID=3029055 RepID=UPI00264747F7|nr:sigma-54 dependent transcriptional regulator [Gallaecimonas kandeliae]WKE66739.1 sigma-54 dependent transcriptional regulator [Gallaecimonas kandeliae]
MTRVLIVEDDAALSEALVDTLELAGFKVDTASSGEEALLSLKEQDCQIVVSDVQMAGMDGMALLRSLRKSHPELPVLLMTAHAKVNDAVEAMKLGAIDYMAKPFAPQVLINMVSRYALADEQAVGPVVADPRSQALLALATKVAKSDATVMVLGPSGSGKEVLARFVHQQSKRSQGPFVAINCAAIPDNMLEATLFGYEKGAFTGAIQACPGKFEQANGGTLLLDEVTEMDLGLQAKLLRVLQEREVERLGGRKTIALDVRVLATSNRDLKEAVADGRFREDLYYRLNVFPLTWPALKDRPGDIVPLAQHLLARHGGTGKHFSEDAEASLAGHSWPGNVRELDNVVQRALILCDGPQIGLEHLLIEGAEDELPNGDGLSGELKAQEAQIILDTLEACNGSRQAVAEKLGISPRTLRYKLAKMRDAGVNIPA